MNLADLLKAKNLSSQLSALGYGKKKPEVKKKAVKTPFKFAYKALQAPVERVITKEAVMPSHDDLKGIIEPLVKQHIAAQEATESDVEITPDMVKKIVQMMHSLPEMDKLEVSKGIRNANSFIYGGTKYGVHEMMHGGSSSATSTSVYGEVVSGSGTSWILAYAPDSGTLRLFANGQRLTETVDYTLVGTAITTVLSWVSGTVLADYQHA